MKKILGLLFLAASFSMTASAASKDLAVLKPGTMTENGAVLPEKKKCTVTVSYIDINGNPFSVTSTASCECTQQQACNVAYAIASIAIP
ncbi:MAG: hypothetical protein EOO13_05080 [Chitinophagaceae bacterium]|nr:MAG: hypothetical protein EOO13_05080 [Chitinophagaceae bacterium]